jgi:hypothetical protein
MLVGRLACREELVGDCARKERTERMRAALDASRFFSMSPPSNDAASGRSRAFEHRCLHAAINSPTCALRSEIDSAQKSHTAECSRGGASSS